MSRDSDAIRSLPEQQKFADDIATKWNCELIQDYRVKDGIIKPDLYMPIDYIIKQKNGKKVNGYIELKCRSVHSDKYNSLMLDLSKMMHIKQYHQYTGLPVFVGVRYINKDVYYKFNPEHKFDVYFTGRTTQTRSEYDHTQCVYINKDYFKDL